MFARMRPLYISAPTACKLSVCAALGTDRTVRKKCISEVAPLPFRTYPPCFHANTLTLRSQYILARSVFSRVLSCSSVHISLSYSLSLSSRIHMRIHRKETHHYSRIYTCIL